MCKLSLDKMNGYVWWKYFMCTQIIKFDWKICKEILKYKFVIMCKFNTLNYYLYLNLVLVYNISNNDI
jgi:hypothetical protein